jgi:hypothetical protein
LVENYYDPTAPDANLVVAAATARLINWPDSLAEIGFPTDLSTFPQQVETALLDRKGRGHKIHTSAYLVRGFEGEVKATSIAQRWVKPLCENPPELRTDSMELMHRNLYGRAGLGTFLAGQVVVDLTYVREGEWTDRHEWAAQGPGSSRFLNALEGRMPVIRANGKQKMSKDMEPDEFLYNLRKFKAAVLELDEVREVAESTGMIMHDFQNVCCETYKLVRLLHYGQQPKASYNARGL